MNLAFKYAFFLNIFTEIHFPALISYIILILKNINVSNLLHS